MFFYFKEKEELVFHAHQASNCLQQKNKHILPVSINGMLSSVSKYSVYGHNLHEE